MTYQSFLERSQVFLEKYRDLEYKQHRIEGLNFAEVQTIVLIARQPQLTLADIARERGISRSAVTQLIKRLEQKGCIRKVPIDDKRFNLELTRQGQAIYQEHQKQHDYINEQLQIIFEQYPEKFLTNLSELMEAVETLWDSLPWNEEL
ncbi:MarR family winged helix-turn-helix transcriptional regulator [Streptococcus dentiloxodontae]